MSYLIFQSIEPISHHEGIDGDEIRSAPMFLDYDPVLPRWPPEEDWAVVPVWWDRYLEQVQRLPALRPAQE